MRKKENRFRSLTLEIERIARTPDSVVIPHEMPRLIRLLGGRFCDGGRDYRMKWGDLAFGRGRSFLFELGLFEEGFSFGLGLLGVTLWVKLPFLRRWAWDPHQIMEAWGASCLDGAWHLCWGRHSKIVTVPWRDWVHFAHDVRRADGSWVPHVGCWEERRDGRDGKEPDRRQYETYPYFYMLQRGELQQRTATICVERRRWRLRWLPFVIRTHHSINVEFSDEVGERSGSWKGGTIGCSYDLKPGETPRECLTRMQRERRF